MDDLLEALRRFDALTDGETGGDVVSRRVLASVAPEYAPGDPGEGLGNRLGAALAKRGIKRLYQHQADAVAQALAGRHVVLQAPTASGKTLAFQIPMLESLCEPGAHALMLYPTKALALDQREQLTRLTSAMGGRRSSPGGTTETPIASTGRSCARPRRRS